MLTPTPVKNPASWIIRETATGRVICETFDARAVQHLNVKKYEAVPILAYLQQLNRTLGAHKSA